jgi:hypothetical protein
MPRLSQDDLLKKYQGNVAAAEEFMKAEGLANTWRETINMYRGLHHPKATDPSVEDRITINVTKALIDSMVPALTLNHPTVAVNGESEEHHDAATIVEHAVNYQFRKYNYRREFAKVQRDSLIMGIGFLKTGWRFVEEPREKSEAELSAQRDALMQAGDQYVADGGDAADVPADNEMDFSPVEMAVVADHPYAERVSPFDILLDPTARDLRGVRWVAQRILLPIEDVQENKNFSAKARKEISGGNTDDDLQKPTRSVFAKTAPNMVAIYEHYDLKTGYFCVFAEGGTSFLAKPKRVPYAYAGEYDSDALGPFIPLPNYESPEYLYPQGEIEPIADLQRELNKLRSMAMNHRKKGAQKYLANTEAFSDLDAITGLLSDDSNLVIPVVPEVDLGNALIAVPTSALHPDITAGSREAIDDIMMVSGANDYAMGVQSERRRTATESSIINDVAQSRSEAKRDAYETFVALAARKITMLNQQFAGDDEVFRVMDPSGLAGWGSYSAEMIQGEFDFSVEVGSAQPLNRAQRRRNALDLAQAMQPFIGLGVVDPVAIVVHLLRDGFDVKNPEKFIMSGGGALGAPPADGGQQLPQGQPLQQTPMESAQQGTSPQMAQLAGQVGLNLGTPSPDGP